MLEKELILKSYEYYFNVKYLLSYEISINL